VIQQTVDAAGAGEEHEANPRARAGERIQVGQSERIWREVRLPDHLLDFNQLVNGPTRWSLAYAACYIVSEADQRGLLMKVGSDDQSRIYLNGNEIYRCEENRSYVPDQDEATKGMDLKAGLNTLVFKVVNQTGEWKGSVQLSDAAGEPLKGMRVTLDPGKLNP
jgi:hypothetical protein